MKSKKKKNENVFVLPCGHHYVIRNGILKRLDCFGRTENVLKGRQYAYVSLCGDEARKALLDLWKWVGGELGYDIDG